MQSIKKWIIIGSISGMLLILIIYFILGYNSFVKKDEGVKNAWSEIQNAYQRRLDLIPNLVGIVKGSSDYERQVLADVAKARSEVGSINYTGNATKNDYDQSEQAQANVTNSMNKVIAVVEKYPDIQSTKSYTILMEQLKGSERRIKFARRDFNASVASYNQSVRSFPSNMIAHLFGFKQKEGFK